MDAIRPRRLLAALDDVRESYETLSEAYHADVCLDLLE